METWAIDRLNAAYERAAFSYGNAELDAFLKTLVKYYTAFARTP